MRAGHFILAYHGCDITLRDDLVSGRISHLNHSDNKYDWLGPGAYFFENDAERALMFARTAQKNPDKLYTKKPIATPGVVGAILQVQLVLDMTTQEGIQEYVLAYQAMSDYLLSQNEQIPVNTKADDSDGDVIFRALDKAVFSFIHASRPQASPPLPDFQAVRSAFPQGEPAAPSSAFRKNSHVQIALRDNSCVQGWFLPRGAELLTEDQYAEAKTRFEEAKNSYKKPRKRAPRTAG